MTREEELDWLYRLRSEIYVYMPKEWLIPMNNALDMAIKDLEQKSKTGHWILADKQNKEDVENDNYRFICSECQCSDIHAKGTIVPYCWKCGCRMVDEQEREVIRNENNTSTR